MPRVYRIRFGKLADRQRRHVLHREGDGEDDEHRAGRAFRAGLEPPAEPCTERETREREDAWGRQRGRIRSQKNLNPMREVSLVPQQRIGRAEAVSPPTRYRGISTDERRALRRKRLIAAAADVYGEVGYRNATVRLICQRAGLTERYFYEAFKSSEELLVVTARSLASQMLDRMRQLRDGSDGDRDAKTLRMLKGYFRSQLDEPSKARVFTLEFRGVSAAADAEFERILDLFADLIVETRDPRRRGPAANDRLLCRGLVGGLLQITVAWIEGGYQEPIDAVARAGALLCTLADKI